MITIKNYNTSTKNIDWTKLPDALKSGHNNFGLMVKHYSTNDKIKNILDSYVEKLNIAASKLTKPKQVSKPKAKKAVPKPASYKGCKIEIRPYSKIAKTYVIWDVSLKQRWANERFKDIAAAQRFVKDNGLVVTRVIKVKAKVKAKATHKKTTKSKVENKAKAVEKITDEVRFIKRYVLMHEKVKTKHQIRLFINALQKAILEKRIRKTSPFALEIQYIQKKLIELYNKMPEQTTVVISKKTLDKYKKIAQSEKSLLSISYIKQYFSIHGRTGVKDKANALKNKLRASVLKSKITENDPYKTKLEVIYKALMEYTQGKADTPMISTAQLNGLMGLSGLKPLFVKKKLKKNQG